ncbi:MAG TPA: patatin-like phospholipase family protein [Bacteroidia bacterium]|nr:patatin-like phospholipase family protein [Bacteroidia bacterium]
MKILFEKHQWLRRIVYFFPIQLFLVVLKKNQLLILFWLLFFGCITQVIAAKYGVPYLFLDPEYLGQVDFRSYLLLGFACGGFIMAFNMASYIMNAFRFPFLATLSNPFFKFCFNNFIIPVTFTIVYCISIYKFQTHSQLAPLKDVLLHITGFLTGNISFILLSILYFQFANKDIQKMFGLSSYDDHNPELKIRKSHRIVLQENMAWKNDNPSIKADNKRDWFVETYMSPIFKIKLARGHEHYEKEKLIQVFKQNQASAAFFEILAILSLFLLGLFRNVSVLQIPAGASVFLLFTLFLMLTSALYTWLRGWSVTVSIIALLLLNYASSFDFSNSSCKAYGMNYNTSKAILTNAVLDKLDKDKSQRNNDIDSTTEILNKWALKNSVNSFGQKEKPKFVMVCTSGGGLRSSLWTFYALQYTDSVLGGKLLKHIELITGSSGGMIGAAYLRELYLEKQENKIQTLYSDSFLVNISKDVLNPLAFSIATNDLFFNFQKFNIGNYSYPKDRAYFFEKKLNENTDNVFNKKLSDYTIPVKEALIPMMIFTPTIINDGRKLLITSQPVSYLTDNDIQPSLTNHPLIEDIEFSKFFKKQDAANLEFTSALRMNATFPYIMPATQLPSNPIIEVMDAGLRDNYGIEPTLKFIYAFRKWLETNTSGIVIIQIRDKHKEFPVQDNAPKTIFQTLTQPINTLYRTLFNVQDFNENEMIEYASLWYKGNIDFVDFQLQNDPADNISLSWHLTNKEKRQVINSIKLPENKSSVNKLKELLQ